MTQKIEESLRRAAAQLPRADFGKIAAADVTPMERHDAITQQTAIRKRPIRFAAALVAACLVLMVAAGGWFWQFGRVDAVVGIEVNPGFEIRLNRAGTVLDIQAFNPEAAEVLEGRNYRGWDLDDAIETLFIALARDGYLNTDATAVLVSASGRSTAASAELASYVSDRVALVTADTSNVSIASQFFQADSNLNERATALGISPGKMWLVLGILEQGVPYSEKDLAPKSTGELIRIALEHGVPGIQTHRYAGTEAPVQEPDSSSSTAAASTPPASSTVPPTPSPPASPPPPPVSQQPSPPALDDDDDDDDDGYNDDNGDDDGDDDGDDG